MPTEVSRENADLPEDKEWEELSDFQKWYYCNKDYHRDLVDDQKDSRREWFWNLKKDEWECEECDEDHPAALDFHHTEDTKDSRAPAKMANDGVSRKKILETLESGRILCRNCHAKLHFREGTGQWKTHAQS